MLPTELKIALIVAVSIVVITRAVYLYCVSWKWNLMIRTYLEYKSLHWSKVQVMFLADACYAIRRKPWTWLDLWFWGEAEEHYDSKTNGRLWFEIVDYWYQNRK